MQLLSRLFSLAGKYGTATAAPDVPSRVFIIIYRPYSKEVFFDLKFLEQDAT
jgi:hypothetical protein